MMSRVTPRPFLVSRSVFQSRSKMCFTHTQGYSIVPTECDERGPHDPAIYEIKELEGFSAQIRLFATVRLPGMDAPGAVRRCL
jgi:hypothetical protein